MKKTVFLLVALAYGLSLYAQGGSGDPEQYGSQYNKLYKSYAKDPENVASMLALAEFYADTLNPMCNFASAMNYICAAEEQYIKIVEDRDKYKEVSRLIKSKITVVLVRQTRQRITLMARDYLNEASDLTNQALDNYTQAFKNDQATIRIIERRRLELRYQQAKYANTLSSYKQFISLYPSTYESEEAAQQMGILATQRISEARSETEVDSLLDGFLDIAQVQNAATRRKSAIAFASLSKNPTPQAYRNFIARYPGSNEYSQVLDMMDNVLKEEFNQLETPRQYADFALQNPDNALADRAIEKLRLCITKERDREALAIYMKEFPLDIKYNDIYLEYFKWHTEEGNKSPLDLFAVSNPDFPFPMALHDALEAAERFDSININMPFEERDFNKWASKVYHLTGKKESYVALQRTLQGLIAAKDWKKALARIDFFSLSFEDYCINEVAELRGILGNNIDNHVTLTPVVRPTYDMIHPVIHPDGKQMYYNRVTDGVASIYRAELTTGKKGKVWRGTGEIVFTDCPNKNLHVFSLFDNGNKMLIGFNGDILIAEQGEDGWHIIEHPSSPVNTEHYEYDAYMLPDGSGMLLASDRPGGQNLQPSHTFFHGDTALASDIYFIPYTKEGWGKAINLGININSPYMECSPVISDDLKTLYFITDGHGGLGYGDVYYSTRDNDWKHWSKPTNYGREVNTGFNELSVTIGPNRKSLTLCSNSNGRYGAYSIDAIHTRNSDFATVTISASQVGIIIDVVDLTTRQNITARQPISRGSSWQSDFYADKHYLLFSSCDGLFLPAIEFMPSNNKRLEPKAYDETTLLHLSETGKQLPLPGIQFEDNRAILLSFSTLELEHLAQFLKSHPRLSVEIMSHVTGADDTFCYNLSLSRAEEVKKIIASYGIDTDRIILSPFGNSQVKRKQSVQGISIIVRQQ